jgi:dUTPase
MSDYIYVLPTNRNIASLMTSKTSKNYEARTLDLFFSIPDDFMLIGRQHSEEQLTYMIPLGFKTYAPFGADMLLLPRSSSGNLRKLPATIDDPPYLEKCKDANIKVFDADAIHLSNTMGYIDWDYRNEWQSLVYVDRDFIVDSSRAYLQAIPMEPTKFSFKLVDDISQIPKDYIETQRGENGFGSTK